jgi:hypothetical protein
VEMKTVGPDGPRRIHRRDLLAEVIHEYETVA